MSNSFGKIFKIATYGESHGKAIGVIIDGCPSGIEINEEDIQNSEQNLNLKLSHLPIDRWKLLE